MADAPDKAADKAAEPEKDKAEKPKSGGLKRAIIHRGVEIPAGEKPPSDLTDAERERLKRIEAL